MPASKHPTCTLTELMPLDLEIDDLDRLLSPDVADFEDLRLDHLIHAARLRPFKDTETDDHSDDE